MTADRAVGSPGEAKTISNPTPRRPVRPVLTAIAAAAWLVGCSAYDAVFGNKDSPPPCPRISVIADAMTVTKFRPGPGRDLTDIVLEGEITAVSLECRRKLDKKTGSGQIAVEISLVFEAERGAADRDRRGALEYFIGVADRDRNVLRKELFSAPVAFTGNVMRVQVTDEPVDLRIPLKAGQTGADFEILIGFQVDRGELEHNRRRTPAVP